MSQISNPLRVLHIISGDLWAGAEAQAFTLLSQLKKHTDLHVVLMNKLELAERLDAAGIATTIIPESSTSSVNITLKLIKLIHTLKPDIIHTHRQKENILGCIAILCSAPFLLRLTPSVRTTHGAPEFAPTTKQRIQTTIDTFLAKHFQKAVIAVSRDLSSQLSKIYPHKKIYIVENGIDVEALKNNASIADFRTSKPNSLHVGIIGRIEPVKRIDIFIEMAIHVMESKKLKKDAQFHVIGDGKLRDEMQKTVAEKDRQFDIIFHGHRTDVSSCISSLDAIIMCSDHEGTPMTSLEALALNTPMIAHNVGGLKEVLAQYPQLLVEEHISSAYSEKLISLLNGPQLEVELNPIYHAQHNAEKTLQLYMEILK